MCIPWKCPWIPKSNILKRFSILFQGSGWVGDHLTISPTGGRKIAQSKATLQTMNFGPFPHIYIPLIFDALIYPDFIISSI